MNDVLLDDQVDNPRLSSYVPRIQDTVADSFMTSGHLDYRLSSQSEDPINDLGTYLVDADPGAIHIATLDEYREYAGRSGYWEGQYMFIQQDADKGRINRSVFRNAHLVPAALAARVRLPGEAISEARVLLRYPIIPVSDPSKKIDGVITLDMNPEQYFELISLSFDAHFLGRFRRPGDELTARDLLRVAVEECKKESAKRLHTKAGRKQEKSSMIPYLEQMLAQE